jgi:integrase/recombinase XerD
VAKILAACARLTDNWGRMGTPEQKLVAARVRAFVLVLRYSGLRIGDAVQLSKQKVKDGRVFIRTEKTKVDVWVPVPEEVAAALAAIENGGELYFWSGESTLHTATNEWRARLAKVFRLAGVEDGHPHRYRHSMATNLLEKGVSVETVALILGNSPAIVLKHYSSFVKSRQVALEDAVRRIWK